MPSNHYQIFARPDLGIYTNGLRIKYGSDMTTSRNLRKLIVFETTLSFVCRYQNSFSLTVYSVLLNYST
jgi:hypothetical protein